MRNKKEYKDEVYIWNPNVGTLETAMTKQQFMNIHKRYGILNKIQEQYPNTPMLISDCGHLMFMNDNNELYREIVLLYELEIMRMERLLKKDNS